LQENFLVIKNKKTKPRTLQVEERRKKISKDASSISQSMTSEGTKPKTPILILPSAQLI
jgi:hypothetical protein